MKSKNKIDLIIGIVIGLCAPLFSIAIAVETFPVLQELGEIANPAWKLIAMRAVSFGVILNAAFFFLIMNWGRDHMARGILIACVPSIIAVIYFQFIA